jgi:hypothetical protein
MWARHKLHALHMRPVRLLIAILENLEIFFLNKKILKKWILLVCSATPPHNGSGGIGSLSIPSKPSKGSPVTLTCRFHTKRNPSKPRKGSPLTLTCRFHTKKEKMHGCVRQNMEKGNDRTVSGLTKGVHVHMGHLSRYSLSPLC